MPPLSGALVMCCSIVTDFVINLRNVFMISGIDYLLKCCRPSCTTLSPLDTHCSLKLAKIRFSRSAQLSNVGFYKVLNNWALDDRDSTEISKTTFTTIFITKLKLEFYKHIVTEKVKNLWDFVLQ